MRERLITPYSLLLILFVLSFEFAIGQRPQRSTEENPWISYPTANVTSYGVYHFRKEITLDQVPEEFIVEVSADNRYNLFVNGKRVSYGPAKGDLTTYKYDVVDIAPSLSEGRNIIAAIVFNAGENKPMAFLSAQTAFLLRSKDKEFSFINTDQSWRSYINPAYDPITYNELELREWLRGYYAVGPGDEVFGDKYPWGWENIDFDDSQWLASQKLIFDGREPWRLVPRNIAFMDNHIEKPKRIRLYEGITDPTGFISENKKIEVKPHTSAKILFDFGVFTMGYPELKVSGGAKSDIKMTFAEALHEAPYLKAHRDSVVGKIMYGPFDIYHPDGGDQRTFRPLWKRTFRYMELIVETKEQPLVLESLINEYSGYPYPEMATFQSNDPELDEIFEMSKRTLRMCSGETYYDTPFYEQLSYGGDNRPIAAISMYNSTDDRLFREVMRLYPQSANRETKLFKSAYPSRFDFDMGTWSLAWIQSLYDYYLIRKDIGFSKQFVNDIEGVLNFHEHHLDESKGVLGTLTNHNFIDWSNKKGSLPTGQPRGIFHHSAILTLYFAHTLDCTVALFNAIGEIEKAERWEALAKKIKKASYDLYWDEEKKLMADFPDKSQFSQHTSILAILCDAVPKEDQQALFDQVLTRQFDEMSSSYFTFFLFKAMEKLGREDDYLKNLDHWYYFMNKGHTTCGETGFMSHDRSDCHAWSAHPAYFHLRYVVGIKPADIGFENITITPHLGELKSVSASMPHQKGRILVNYRIKGNKIQGEITLPDAMNGTFSLNGTDISLKSGKNKISVKF